MGKCVVWLWRLWLGLWIWWIWLWPRIPWILRWIPIQIWLWILWPKKRGPLNQKQKPAQMLGMDTEDMVDTMVATMAEVMATHMDTTDTTVKCHAIETVPAKTTLPSSL